MVADESARPRVDDPEHRRGHARRLHGAHGEPAPVGAEGQPAMISEREPEIGEVNEHRRAFLPSPRALCSFEAARPNRVEARWRPVQRVSVEGRSGD
jgi:hypothetical protein